MNKHRLSFLLGLLGLAGCTVGPDYARPEMALPAAYNTDSWSPPLGRIRAAPLLNAIGGHCSMIQR